VYLPRNLLQLHTIVHARNNKQNKEKDYEITYMSCVENAKLCVKHIDVMRLILSDFYLLLVGAGYPRTSFSGEIPHDYSYGHRAW
jgi:hypothetical protein